MRPVNDLSGLNLPEIRCFLAGQALSGLLAGSYPGSLSSVTRDAVRLADLLLEELGHPSERGGD